MRRRYKYRFKTKEEFINEYGEIRRTVNESPSFIDRMDYLIGNDIEDCFYNDIENEHGFVITNFPNGFRYRISSWMYVKKQILPDYRPKTFIKN